MRVKYCFAFLCLLAVLAFGRDPYANHQVNMSQNMQAEEILLRTAYAKLSYADEVGIILREVRRTSRAKLWKTKANLANAALNERLSFELDNFQFGKLSTIANSRMADFDGSPSAVGGEVLEVIPSVFNYRVEDSPAKYVAYAKFAWKPSPNQSLALQENWPVSKALQEEQFEGKKYTDYVTYRVTLTFAGKSRTYNAWMLFGPGAGGQQQAYFMDPVVNSTGVLFASEHSVYPTALAETDLNTVPFVNKWLYDNAQSCNARQNEQDQIADVCCDPQNGRCGVSRSFLLSRGFHRLPPGRRPEGRPLRASFHISSANLHPLVQATSCSGYNTSTVFPDTQPNTAEHVSGDHVLFSVINGSCTYEDGTAGSDQCSVSCAANSSPEGVDTGTLANPLYTHYLTTAQSDGANEANGGSISCAGLSAMAVKSCLFSCAADITISGGGGTGVGATANFAPGALWTTSFSATQTCAARNNPNPCPSSDISGVSPRIATPCSNPGTGGDTSPIIIDTGGEGFHLTSADAGVTFDIRGTGQPLQMAWTDPHYQNAFLALPGADGLVHNGKELFGNFTPQPPSQHPNGFIALAQYDKRENGGNGDGIIDDHDEVFSQLRLWIDENHDGICQPDELHRLPELGIYSLALNYVESRRTDQFGNQFRYKARVNPGERRDPRDETPAGDPGRWTYDVFFATK